jgi:excisionase family DNA binding protein
MQDEFAQDKNMLTIGEAANFTNLSIDTLRRWEKRGKIIAYRSPGGHRYFNKRELTNVFKKRYKRDAPKPADTIPVQVPTPTAIETSAPSVPEEDQRSFRTHTHIDNSFPETTQGIADVEQSIVDISPSPSETTQSFADVEQSTDDPKLDEGADHTQPRPHPHFSLSSEESPPPPRHHKHLTPSSVLDGEKSSPPVDLHLKDDEKADDTNSVPKPHYSKDGKTKAHKAPKHKEEKLSKLQKLIWGAFFAFLIIDILLLLLLRAWNVPILPVL